jgi:hypothetical protein
MLYELETKHVTTLLVREHEVIGREALAAAFLKIGPLPLVINLNVAPLRNTAVPEARVLLPGML